MQCDVNFFSNKLTALPDNLFANNPDLYMVNFNSNPIAELPSTLFANLDNLGIALFEFATFPSLPLSLFDATPFLVEVDLSGCSNMPAVCQKAFTVTTTPIPPECFSSPGATDMAAHTSALRTQRQRRRRSGRQVKRSSLHARAVEGSAVRRK